MIALNTLLAALPQALITTPPHACVRGERPVLSLTPDSRQAGEDTLFVCICGAQSDGHNYAAQAYAQGCRAFVAERPLSLPDDACVTLVTDSRRALAHLSAAFYGYPAREMTLIGITGTKGKTTTALLIRHMLEENGIPTGYIGSNGIEYADIRRQTANTTPESCVLHRTLREMADAGVRVAVLEVSSQALYLHRVEGIDFPITIFTNLSRDHIGGAEHPTFEHYRACKRSLFTAHHTGCIIANLDDPAAREMTDNPDAGHLFVSTDPLAVEDEQTVTARAISLFRRGNRLGVEFICRCGGEEVPFSLPIPGAFNAQNALCAAAVGLRFGLRLADVAAALETVSIKGRFEPVEAEGLESSTFLIDYAHNGVSLRAALETLRAYRPNRLICLFGSVGGRTQMRRPELGAVAGELCDLVILTADNPDFEDPAAIISDIAAAIPPPPVGAPFLAFDDRRDAIRAAVREARPGDIVLLAGKGHENYQLICGKKVPFDERAILREAAARLRMPH